MKIFKKSETKIHPFDEESEDEMPLEEEHDRYDIMNSVDRAFKDSRIRPDNYKKLSRVITVDGKVVGGVYTSLLNDGQDGMEFSFDVAISPAYRAKNNQGLGDRTIIRILDDVMQEFRSYQSKMENVHCKLIVVNGKLVKILEQRYGFDVEPCGGQWIATK